MPTYENEYRRSVTDPQGYWLEQAADIAWYQFPKTALENDVNGIERWFPDGQLNSAYLALDYHCEQGRGKKPRLSMTHQ